MIAVKAALSACLFFAYALLGERPCVAGTTGVLSGCVLDYGSRTAHPPALVSITICSGLSCAPVDTRSADSHGYYTFMSLAPGPNQSTSMNSFDSSGDPEFRLIIVA